MSWLDKINTVPFDETDIREYLDRVIVHWRERREEASEEKDKLKAVCYIDAYQSVRMSIFGELLK
jgi:hypothetical protein